MSETMAAKLSFLVFLLFSVSCKNKKLDEKSELSKNHPKIDSLFDSKFTNEVKSQNEIESEEIQDTITEFEFKDLSVSIDRLATYEEDSIKEKSSRSDTVLFYIDLAESIEGQKLRIESNTLIEIKAEMAYQTSASIQNEGPHCDLNNWKHYTSPFIKLAKISQNEFLTSSYEAKDFSKFPKISIEELKKVVKKECGEDWYKHVQKVKNVTEYPSDVGISRYFIRISGVDKQSGETKVKLIIIESPLGC